MNKAFRTINSLILLAVITLTSCGYVSDKPPANIDVYRIEQLQNCKIDVSKLSEIFTTDQKEQIKCIQENFVQFTKYVRSQNSTSVSEGELNTFIKKFFEGQSESIVKGLSLIFQLNMLLLHDEADRISRNNISPLFELLVHVNQEAIVITQVLKEISEESNQGHFWDLRARFVSSVNRFSDFTLKIIKNSPNIQQKLNIKNFILDASDKLGMKQISPETIDTLIFLKRFLVAGDKVIITSDELETLVTKLPKILTMSFDLFYVKNTNFASDSDQMRFYLNELNDLYQTIEFSQENFSLFSIDQLLKLIQDFMPDTEVNKFKPSVVALKTKIIGGSNESFSLNDLRKMLDTSKDLVEKIYFNQITYNSYSNEIESNKETLSLPQLKLPNDYNMFSLARVSELHKDFQGIASDIRYFRSKEQGVPYYSTTIMRNRYGFLEAALLKWGVSKLLEGYGHKNAQGQLQVSLEEFQVFLNDMRPVLEVFKLWSPKPETFARNAVLLADLFQNKSNGDLEVSEIEATEYVQMILSAVSISDKFSSELSSVCNSGANKDDPAFETECYNEQFFDTLLNKANYKKFFPQLSKYIETTSKKEIKGYLEGVEGFARDINDPKIPINSRDGILILGAMLNIESTLIRFDFNKDNVIDNKTRAFPNDPKDQRTELEVAFEVYKKAIISVAKLKPAQEKYAYSIFLYMIKYMQVPPTATLKDNAKFLYFHLWESSNLVAAKRLNVGTILYFLVKQSSPSAFAPKSESPQK